MDSQLGEFDQPAAPGFNKALALHTFTVTSNYGPFAVRTALLRAVFHLKMQGYGKDDVEMAGIIEQLEFKERT